MVVDLHTHTYYSDGIYSPLELMKRAKKANLEAIAVTDHDTVNGLPEAIEAGKKLGVEVIPGVEFSCGLYGLGKKIQDIEFHLLGLFVDYENTRLIKDLAYIRSDGREKRIKIMMERMHEKYGIKITMKDVLEVNKEIKMQIGIPQLAKILQDRGIAMTRVEAKQYLGPVNTSVQYKIEDAIDVIHGAGGLAVLAHPLNSMFKEKVPHVSAPESQYPKYERIIKYLKSKCLDGLEVNHVWSTGKDRTFLKKMARKYDLLYSGGTDFHRNGIETLPPLGSLKIPYFYVRKMKARKIFKTT